MTQIYDVICIGAGSGGLNIAGFMNRAGFKTLLIDKSDTSIGGDCLNFGCVPSKALIHVAREFYAAQKTTQFGLKTAGSADMKKIMQYVTDKKEVIREHENAAHFEKIGMDVVLGKASFASKNSVTVNGKEYFGKKIIIATGSRPRQINIPGIEDTKYHTNETIFSLDQLPKNMVIVGGGPIGIELGQCFNRFGSNVTVIDRKPQFLPKERKDVAEILKAALEKEGMHFQMASTPLRIEDGKTLIVKDSTDKEVKLPFDTMLVSGGRQLNVEGLELEKAGIEMDGNKIKVNEYLETTNKNVLLCGDIAGSYQFTHAAELHAGVIITNFFSPLKKKIDYSKLGWVTYTDPEIATFGLNEDQLNEDNIEYTKHEITFEDDDRAIVDEGTAGKLILFISKKQTILGGTMIGQHAGELSQELMLANSAELNIKAIFGKTYPYPTATRINKKLISTIFAGKLNERTKKILRFMYR